MPIHVLQWVVAKRIAALAVGFLLISDFNAILLSVSVLLLCIVFQAVNRNIEVARRIFDRGTSDIFMCIS